MCRITEILQVKYKEYLLFCESPFGMHHAFFFGGMLWRWIECVIGQTTTWGGQPMNNPARYPSQKSPVSIQRPGGIEGFVGPGGEHERGIGCTRDGPHHLLLRHAPAGDIMQNNDVLKKYEQSHATQAIYRQHSRLCTMESFKNVQRHRYVRRKRIEVVFHGFPIYKMQLLPRSSWTLDGEALCA